MKLYNHMLSFGGEDLDPAGSDTLVIFILGIHEKDTFRKDLAEIDESR